MERGRDGNGLLKTDIARRCASRKVNEIATRVLQTG